MRLGLQASRLQTLLRSVRKIINRASQYGGANKFLGGLGDLPLGLPTTQVGVNHVLRGRAAIVGGGWGLGLPTFFDPRSLAGRVSQIGQLVTSPSSVPKLDPCQLVWQVKEIDGRTRILRSCQASWQGAREKMVVWLSRQSYVPAAPGGRGRIARCGQTSVQPPRDKCRETERLARPAMGRSFSNRETRFNCRLIMPAASSRSHFNPGRFVIDRGHGLANDRMVRGESVGHLALRRARMDRVRRRSRNHRLGRPSAATAAA